jgi:hypothetical protein
VVRHVKSVETQQVRSVEQYPVGNPESTGGGGGVTPESTGGGGVMPPQTPSAWYAVRLAAHVDSFASSAVVRQLAAAVVSRKSQQLWSDVQSGPRFGAITPPLSTAFDPLSRVPLSRVDRDPLSLALPASPAATRPSESTPVNALHAEAKGTATKPNTSRNERISGRMYATLAQLLPDLRFFYERP